MQESRAEGAGQDAEAREEALQEEAAQEEEEARSGAAQSLGAESGPADPEEDNSLFLGYRLQKPWGKINSVPERNCH